MKALARQEQGSALIAAIVLVGVMMAIGLATASFVDGQQRQSGADRTRESAFNVAESALGAQVFQLSQAAWPATSAAALPASCTPATTATTSCPDAASLGESYKTADYSTAACPGGAASPPPWTTYVHDDSDGAAGSQQYYSATMPNGTAQPRWDSNGNGRMWVKSTGTARCKLRTLITAVQQTTKPLSFPRNAVTANWIATNNTGRKVIINSQGSAGQSADVVARCTVPAPAPCIKYSTGQISPAVPKEDSSSLGPALSVDDLAAFKALAVKQGTFYRAGQGCPTSLTGTAVYVEDFTGCSAGNANSAAAPGVLYIGRGTLSLGGNTKFYGLVYMGNLQSSSGAVVTLSGNAQVVGAVAIDGLGGLVVGSSKQNVFFDGRAFDLLKGIATVAQAPNSFRELPPGS